MPLIRRFGFFIDLDTGRYDTDKCASHHKKRKYQTNDLNKKFSAFFAHFFDHAFAKYAGVPPLLKTYISIIILSYYDI